jgi:hypothetical protein
MSYQFRLHPRSRLTFKSATRLSGLVGATGAPGADGLNGSDGSDGARIFSQASAPATTFPEGSIWIDTDSTDVDVYSLTAGVWVDTLTNLKGPPGGTPGGANTEVQFNNAGSFGADASLTFDSANNVLGGTDLVITPTGTGAISYSSTNPTVGGDANFRRAFDITSNWQDPQVTNPNFSTALNISTILNAKNGQNVHGGGTNAKTSFIGAHHTVNAISGGQRLCQALTMNAFGHGDAACEARRIEFSGGPINGDEGTGWSVVNHLNQQNTLSLATISSVTTPATINTTTTQIITANKDEQTVTVASSAGVIAGQWVIVEQQVPSGQMNLEAVQIVSVPGGTSIRGIFRNNHANGVTVTPALVLVLDNTQEFGEQRVLVNLSGTSYSTGTVSSISGGGFTGTGTAWTSNIVGGSALNVGAIALDIDTYTGDPFDDAPGSGQGPLKAWHQILNVSSGTALGVHSFSVAGDTSYKGKGITPANLPSTYTIRPAARILQITGSTVVCEQSTHTWTAADNVECTICPYPDVTGYQHHLEVYAPGGTLRGFSHFSNNGARTFGIGLSIGSNMKTGGGADTIAFDVGISVSAAVQTGIDITSATASGISLPSSSVNGSKLTWSAVGGYVGWNQANLGIDIQATNFTSGADGFLRFFNPDVTASGLHEGKWGGVFEVTRGVRVPTVAVGSLPTADANNKGIRYMVSDANATTFWTVVAGGGANIIPVTSDGTNWRIG